MAALDTLEVNYERLEGLIVGSGHEYEFVLNTVSDVEGTMACLMSDMADDLNNLLSDFDDDEDTLIEEDLDSLIEIESKLNEMVTENRKVIDAFNIEYISENDIVNDIVHKNIEKGEPTNKYSDIADERNLEIIKSKLKDTVQPVKENKSKNKKKMTV